MAGGLPSTERGTMVDGAGAQVISADQNVIIKSNQIILVASNVTKIIFITLHCIEADLLVE